MTDELINRRLGQYQLIELIRRGGMAAVYKAYQPALDRFVAVKVMLHTSGPQFTVRFEREARAIAQLQHPNILPVYDYGEQEGLLYLVLQYVQDGITLTNRMGMLMAPIEALELTRRVLTGLEYAHGRGIIHRDIKPGNVLLPAPDWPMLADFGIAKLLNDSAQQLTAPGLAIGTVAYMAPEQALARPVDARTDIYSTGVMLYEMLTGRLPFDTSPPMVALTRHVYEPPPRPSQINPGISSSVEQLVLRALAKRPEDRYQTAGEMAAALDELIAQLRLGDPRSQLAELYQSGLRAFSEGRWDQAETQFGRVVALDPQYEDSAELLAAARAAGEHARAEAREQIEQVRQRRISATQTPPSGAQPAQPLAAAVGETSPHAPPPRGLDTARLEPGPPLVAAYASADPAQPGPAPMAPGAPPANRADGVVAGASKGPRRVMLIIGAVLALLVMVIALVAALLPIRSAAVVTAEPTPVAATAVQPPPQPSASGQGAPSPLAQPTDPGQSAPSQPPAAEPPAPAGIVVQEDDFNTAGEQSGLVDRDDDLAFSRGFHPPGVYHFRLSQPDETRLALMPRRVYGDFSTQIEVWDNSDDLVGGVAQGVIFRARDAEHYYALLLDPRRGRYSLRKQDGAEVGSELIPWQDSPLVKRGAEHNTIRIDAAGDTFTIYLNGRAAGSFTDAGYQSGMLGLIVANDDAASPHMHFDNLSVWSADPAPPDPGLALTRDTPTGAMVLIAGGPFIMGDNQRPEAPPHLVNLPSFYLDQTEVTNAAYARCVADGSCDPQQSLDSQTHPGYAVRAEYGAYPALHVSWQQASQFCRWAGKRLPSEAEWEKAASWSADQGKAIWPWGDSFDPARLNSEESVVGDTTAVDAHPPELNGTHDMAGNVSEWTSTLYQDYPYEASDGREDQQAGGDRVFRGGSWAQTQGKARGALRQSAAPEFVSREIGFRCATTP